MQIAVTGPNGRLGSALVKKGCIPLDFNICDEKACEKELGRIKPDALINCAAWTDVDGAEDKDNLAEVLNTNLRGPGILRTNHSGLLIQISTGFVFGEGDGPFAEDDEPLPISWYGWSKWGGEKAAQIRMPTLVVRTLDLFGPETPIDFVRQVRDIVEFNIEMELPDTLFGTPTYIPHLAEALLIAVERELTGTIHIAGDLTLSRYDWGRMIAEYFEADPDLIKPTKKIKGKAPRPLRGGLKVDKAVNMGLPIYSPLDGLRGISEWENARGQAS